jgi:hypothetical protein
MSRRAKKQQSDRAPASGTRFSNERPNQRKKQRVGKRGLERRRSKALLAVVPSEVSNSAPPDSVAAAARGSAELTPPRGLASLPRTPNAAAEHPLFDEALLDVESAFFQGGILSEATASDPLVTESQPAIDADDSWLLTPEQQQRRQWFRRQVTRLVAGMGAFGTVAMAVRIASLL